MIAVVRTELSHRRLELGQGSLELRTQQQPCQRGECSDQKTDEPHEVAIHLLVRSFKPAIHGGSQVAHLASDIRHERRVIFHTAFQVRYSLINVRQHDAVHQHGVCRVG